MALTGLKRTLVVGTIAVGAVGVPSVATAATTVGSASGVGEVSVPRVPPTEVQGEEVTRPPEVQGEEVNRPEVLGETVQSNNLAMTGSDIAGTALLGTGLTAAGAIALKLRRRKSD